MTAAEENEKLYFQGHGIVPPHDADRKATQEFAVQNVLTTYCGQRLTPDLIDRIVAELKQEMQTGPTAWAFGVGGTDGTR